MSITEIFSTALLVAAFVFFLASTVGLIRFPDVYTRLHALTKADNLGLGCLCGGLLLQAPSLQSAMKLLLIWLLVLYSSATVAHLIAHAGYEKGVKPWQRPE